MLTTRPTTAGHDPMHAGAVFEHSQNAISILLQPPMLRAGLRPHTPAPVAGLYKAPTARDIPPVALTAIRTVDDAAFHVYNQRVGAIFGQLHRLKDTEGGAQVSTQRRRPGQVFPNQRGSVALTTSEPDDEAERPAYRQGSSASQHGGPPALSIIPHVYFDRDFHLQNPRTFDVVSEQSYIAGTTCNGMGAGTGAASTAKKPLATNAILQEKLSWYLDTVEVYLINSISLSATAFFSALLSLRDLYTDVEDSLQKVKLLRESFALLETDIVAEQLELLRKRRMLYNLRLMSDTVLQLQRIVDGVGHIEASIERGHVEEALDEIDATERLMAGERGDAPNAVRLRDLRGTAALQGAVSDLSILRSRIGTAFEKKVFETLIGDLQHHVQSVSTENVIMRWEAAFQRPKGSYPREISDAPAYMRMTSELREALSPDIRGLYRSGALSSAVQSYRELALREIRDVIRKPLPSSADDAESAASTSTSGTVQTRTNQEKSSMLARNIRALDAADAERLFSSIFIGVTETLRRLQTQSSVLLDIAYTMQQALDAKEPDEVRSERQKDMHVALDLSNLVGEAVDVSHEKINKILRVRSEQSTSLPLEDFLRYFTLNLLFANECEAISGRAGASLKTIVNGHIQDFIAAHKDQETQALTEAMDADMWQVQDGTAQDRAILQQILTCSTSDPPQWAMPTKNWAPLASQEKAEGAMHSAEDESTSSNADDVAAQGAMAVEEETFFVPRSALFCLVGMSHFLRLIGGIPSMAPDIALSLAAYLQVFDSRCRQLVLGVGALCTAGLRNINTSHLALVSRAVVFVAALIPYIREFVRRHLPTGGAANARAVIGEFDKVRRALQEHQAAIHQKLADIMASRALALSIKARETEWAKEEEGEEGAQSVQAYMVDLAKDTSKLYKVLVKYLPAHEVGLVMVPVFASYKDRLSEAFRAANPRTETGKAR